QAARSDPDDVVQSGSMRKRPLGKTGLVVSELAIGTWGLAGEAYGKVEEADAERVLQRAIEVGFSGIDTADAYGAGKMERLAGRMLRDHPDLVVVTKGGIDRTTDPPRKCFDPDFLRGAVERSCKRLGVEALPLYLLHNPTPETLHGGEPVVLMEEL